MKNVKIRKNLIVALATCASLAIVGGVNVISASAEDLASFKVDGASVRFMQEGETTDNSTAGLRFAGRILKSEYQGLDVVEIGALIAPNGSYTGALDLTNTDADIRKVVVKGTVDEEVRDGAFTVVEDENTYLEYRAYVYNIPSTGYYRELDCAYYLKTATDTYVTSVETRSIGYVATQAILDVKAEQVGDYQYAVDGGYSPFTDDQRASLNGYITTHTVSFGEDATAQTVMKGEKAVKPADPEEKEGYTFMGWLLDGEAYDFTAPVTGDITLTADWFEHVRLTEEQLLAGYNFDSEASLAYLQHDVYTDGTLATIKEVEYPMGAELATVDNASSVNFRAMYNTVLKEIRMEPISLPKGSLIKVTYKNMSLDKNGAYVSGSFRINGAWKANFAANQAEFTTLTYKLTEQTDVTSIAIGVYSGSTEATEFYLQSIVVLPSTVTEEQLLKGINFNTEDSLRHFTINSQNVSLSIVDEMASYTAVNGNPEVGITFASPISVKAGDKIALAYKSSSASMGGIYINSGTYLSGLPSEECVNGTVQVYEFTEDTTLTNLYVRTWTNGGTFAIEGFKLVRPLTEAQLTEGYTFTKYDVALVKAVKGMSVTWDNEKGLKITVTAADGNSDCAILLNDIVVNNGDTISLTCDSSEVTGKFGMKYYENLSSGTWAGSTMSKTFTSTLTLKGLGTNTWSVSGKSIYVSAIKLVKA